MPVIKSAKKKLKQDKKRTLQNEKIRFSLKSLIKKAKKSPTEKSVKEAVRALNKAAKKHIIHKNKASHIKSTLSKLLGAKKPQKQITKAASKAKKPTRSKR